jgi:predicted ATP-grasp superfamily ATP-dependent carboligase
LKVLIFEYATALGLEDPEFLLEGRAILEGLLEDFNKINNDFLGELNNDNLLLDNKSQEHNRELLKDFDSFEVSYLISEKFLNQKYIDKWEFCRPVIMNNDFDNDQSLEYWLENNISNFDACIFMAAEENLELFKLTRIIENKGVFVLAPTSEAVLLCSDKLKTYKHLKKCFKDDSPLINTYAINMGCFKEESAYGNDITDEFFHKYSPLFDHHSKMVIKPADGVACQGIKILKSFLELVDALKSMKTSLPYILLQKFVEGQPCSVSLISDGVNAIPLSLNLQKIKFDEEGFEYGGGQVPWDHPLKDEAMEIAKNAVESIEGIKGYVGVDLILSDRVHLLEINSRLTTPYIALRNLTNQNLALVIIKSVHGKIPEKLDIYGCIEFQKGIDNMNFIKKINH